MMKVFYFSAAGHCRELAGFFARSLSLPMEELGKGSAATDTAIVVFPVYCQSLPRPLRSSLPRLQAENFVLIAAYGRMHPGSALREAAKLCRGRLIAGANVPTGHSYLKEDFRPDTSRLTPILRRIARPEECRLPPKLRQPFAGLAPGLRSRLGVKILRSEKCSRCGLCGSHCPMGSMKNGRPGGDCIRCLRCVHECPKRALSFRLHPLLKAYLSAPKREEYEIYL